jgi:hypothetical protein
MFSKKSPNYHDKMDYQIGAVPTTNFEMEDYNLSRKTTILPITERIL